ncbi:hypothetical protein [Peribacillus asahii]|nr:hypothetical protein [Peribacillus asahii]
MICSNRIQHKIIGYSLLFKKLGIFNEAEYKYIVETYQVKEQ